jgi:hypothetical protein
MKKIVFFAILLLLSVQVNAQKATRRDIYVFGPITWLGLDFYPYRNYRYDYFSETGCKQITSRLE